MRTESRPVFLSPMHKPLHMILMALPVLALSCHSSSYNARIFHPWGCDNVKEFKARMDEFTNVLMVCVYEDHWEDRGPNRYSLHHLKGTVVRVYKGDWRVSERIAFVRGLDYRAPTNPKSEAGTLGFVFTNEHTNAEIGLDTGEFGRYEAEYEPALDHTKKEKATAQ